MGWPAYPALITAGHPRVQIFRYVSHIWAWKSNASIQYRSGFENRLEGHVGPTGVVNAGSAEPELRQKQRRAQKTHATPVNFPSTETRFQLTAVNFPYHCAAAEKAPWLSLLQDETPHLRFAKVSNLSCNGGAIGVHLIERDRCSFHPRFHARIKAVLQILRPFLTSSFLQADTVKIEKRRVKRAQISASMAETQESKPVADAEKKKEQSISFFKLFSFADKYDWLLMTAGSLGAVVHGSAMPVFFLLFGDLVNGFGKNQADLRKMTEEVSKVRRFSSDLMLCISYISGSSYAYLRTQVRLLLQSASIWLKAGEHVSALPAGTERNGTDGVRHMFPEAPFVSLSVISVALLFTNALLLSRLTGFEKSHRFFPPFLFEDLGTSDCEKSMCFCGAEIACWMYSGERQVSTLRKKYLQAVLKQDVGFFDTDARTGDIVFSVSTDTLLVQDAISEKV
ncbi:hypothetical protein ACLOJK_013058 [Asimina triloba]